MHKSKDKNKGFTLIELMVVITILGMMSAIVLTTIAGARDKGTATKIIRDMQEIKKAIVLLADDSALNSWWIDNSVDTRFPQTCLASGSPDDLVSISCLVGDTARLGKYLKVAPTPYAGGVYNYDSDANATAAGGSILGPTGCITAADAGVNIVITGLTNGVRDSINDLIDKGETTKDTCGRVHYDATGLYFKLGWRLSDIYN
jgi:prepilin-type N-terminal cleavage/methylation domain-containing protein